MITTIDDPDCSSLEQFRHRLNHGMIDLDKGSHTFVDLDSNYDIEQLEEVTD